MKVGEIAIAAVVTTVISSTLDYSTRPISSTLIGSVA